LPNLSEAPTNLAIFGAYDFLRYFIIFVKYFEALGTPSIILKSGPLPLYL